MRKSKYEIVLEIAKLAEEMDFKEKMEQKVQEEDKIKKIINKPKTSEKIAYKAFLTYMKKNKQKNESVDV